MNAALVNPENLFALKVRMVLKASPHQKGPDNRDDKHKRQTKAKPDQGDGSLTNAHINQDSFRQHNENEEDMSADELRLHRPLRSQCLVVVSQSALKVDLHSQPSKSGKHNKLFR